MNPQPTAAIASTGQTSPPLDLALTHLARILIRRELDADVPWLAVENAERHLAGVIATASLAANLAGRETTFRTASRAMETGKQARRPLLSAQFHAAMAAAESGSAKSKGVFLRVPASVAQHYPRKNDDRSPIHVTVLYLGKVDSAKEAQYLKIIEGVLPQFKIGRVTFKAPAWFQNDAGEWIYHTPVECAGLADLRKAIWDSLEAAGLEVGDAHRKFKPHCTIAYCGAEKKYTGKKSGWVGTFDVNRVEVWGFSRTFRKNADRFAASSLYSDPLAPLENNGGPNDGDNDGAYDVPPLPTYQQAVDAILRRTPAVARTWQDVAAVMARNGIAFARAATQKIADRIRESLAGTIAVGQGREYAVSLMQLIAPWTRAYSEMVYRTNTAQAYTDGLVEFASDPSVSDAVAGFRFSATGDANTRPNHQAADGLTARADDMVWQQLRPPLGYACFPAGVNVSGAFTGASRIWYDGPIVIIQSRNGRRLPVTVNHPILTRRGWIRAEEVRNGDDCVCYGNEVESFAHRAGNWPLPDVAVCGRAINDQDVPARIENVFDAFRADRTGAGVFCRMRALPLDFNGDGRFANGNIDIYSIDGVFERATNATQFKGIENRICELVANTAMFAGHRLSAVATLGGSDDASDVGGMSGGNLPFYGIRASGPDFDPLQPLLFGRAALLNASIGETQIDRNAGHAEFLSQLVDAGTGEIFFDKVINVERNSHHGYVYDLESASSRKTGNGWMVTNGIVTSNCRCRLIVLTTAEAKRRRMLTSRGVLPDAVWPTGAYPDPGFRR